MRLIMIAFIRSFVHVQLNLSVMQIVHFLLKTKTEEATSI